MLQLLLLVYEEQLRNSRVRFNESARTHCRVHSTLRTLAGYTYARRLAAPRPVRGVLTPQIYRAAALHHPHYLNRVTSFLPRY